MNKKLKPIVVMACMFLMIVVIAFIINKNNLADKETINYSNTENENTYNAIPKEENFDIR